MPSVKISAPGISQLLPLTVTENIRGLNGQSIHYMSYRRPSARYQVRSLYPIRVLLGPKMKSPKTHPRQFCYKRKGRRASWLSCYATVLISIG